MKAKKMFDEKPIKELEKMDPPVLTQTVSNMNQAELIKALQVVSGDLAMSKITKEQAVAVVKVLLDSTSSTSPRSKLFENKALKGTPKQRLGVAHRKRLSKLAKKADPVYFADASWGDDVK